MADDREQVTFVELLRSTINNFEIEEDLQTFDRIDVNLKRLREKRDLKLEETRAVLKNLSRQADLARASAESSQNTQLQKQAAEDAMKLEREKFALAKNINDLESSYASNLAILEKLKDELEQLNSEDTVESAGVYVEDATVLRLKLYRSLGISFDGESVENPTKALIQSTSTNNVHVFPLDKNYSEQFVANFLWEKL
ncbi:hypothetical protein TRVA0_036S01266 [Trichomonascus vanleenenianus]|uniref:kinetochore-associated Ndc80 complex subunit SPC24 n=1 Tax=Trichomonascus vanleenenianus TaxID=2268995 RepID=UPI003ECB5772